MNPILVTVGVACVVFAIVGGGGKVLEVELPVIHQPWRIAVLAVAGVGFLLAAYVTREPAPRPVSGEVTAYRAMVAQICTNMAPRTNAFATAMNTNGTFDRTRLQQALGSQANELRATMTYLWQQPIPSELTETAAAARSASDKALSAADEQIAAIPTKLPKTISIQQLQVWGTELSEQLSDEDAAMRSTLSQLSAQPCTAPSS